MVVSVVMYGTVVEVVQVVLHHLVNIAVQLVDRVVNQITLIRVGQGEVPVVETLICQGEVEKCHMVQTMKVWQVHHSGIKQGHHTIITTTKKKSLMDNGVLVVVMVIIHSTITHTTTQMVVRES